MSGKIEIERRGFLTVAEKAIIQNAMGEDNQMVKVYAAVREIADKEGLTAQKVFEDLSESEQPAYLANHQEHLSDIFAGMVAHDEKMRLLTSTTLIMTRVNPEWDPSSTADLHPDLQQALYDLYKDEERKSVEALEVAAEDANKAQAGAVGKE